MKTEKMFMNIFTGSVDTADGWDDLSEVVEVEWSEEEQCWAEVIEMEAFYIAELVLSIVVAVVIYFYVSRTEEF